MVLFWLSTISIFKEWFSDLLIQMHMIPNNFLIEYKFHEKSNIFANI